MKSCPRCQITPHWHYARNTSRAAKREMFLLLGCAHCHAWRHGDTLCGGEERAEVEACWDAHAEELFADYIKRWTEQQRARFRTNIYHNGARDYRITWRKINLFGRLGLAPRA